MHNQNRIYRPLVLVGPTAVGKGTVLAQLRRWHPEIFVSISATTREPRPGECNGIHYYFLTKEEFERSVKHGEMLEWAIVHGEHYYGTPAGPVREKIAAGQPVILEIDLQGARQLRETLPEALFVFLEPPSWNELVSRLRGRATEDPQAQERRLETARTEMAAADEFDVRVVNAVVSDTARELERLMGLPAV